ncbi:hypothetical protein [Pseudomonas sp. BC42]|uniref:hypothetical protein n=1 Tax=Pseudomonas sp. BC42 TaxID=2933816 RepID=UPI001F2F743C|nr:hypothetical protein [Pseudomonas sp. BC42]ULT73046.1 hypothetical protein L1O02_11970 [Pseudomonas sp. BC42]
MRILVGAVAVALLAGCSSNAITVQQAKQAPKDQVYAFQARPAGAYGAITVLRDGGINASACDFVIYVDGKKAAKLGSSQKATFYVKPGSLNLGVGLAGTGLCMGQAIRTMAAEAVADRETIFRVSSDMAGMYIGPYIEY